MYEQITKPKENTASANRRESKTVTNSGARKKINFKRGFGFLDNRPKTILQQKLQDRVSNTRLPLNTHDVAQLSREIAQRNWRTVNQYSHDQAERAVREFLRSGYTPQEIGRMIVPLVDRLGHGDQVFAHGRGGSDSGTQGDTMDRIRACIDDLIDWARANPKPKEEKKTSGKYNNQGGNSGGKGGEGEGSSGGEGRSFGTGHLASWITGVPAWYSNRTDKY